MIELRYNIIMILSLIITSLMLYFNLDGTLNNIILFLLFVIFNILIIIYSTRKIIRDRVNKLYKNISIIDANIFNIRKGGTNINSLIKNISKYTEIKKEEIEVLNKREDFRREFIGNLSHELKTPLFTTQSYLSIIEDNIKEGNLEDVKTHISKANKCLKGLTDIVEQMDEISNIESRKYILKLEKINIIEKINTIFEELELIANKNKIKLEFDRFYSKPINIYGDKEKIKQVFYNLILNSIHYGNTNGKTIISIKNHSEYYDVIIQDNGIGMSKENVNRIFERFYRVEKSRSRNTGGAGLGLSIVKHIMELHGEKISIESIHSEGTKITLRFKKIEE